MRTKKMNVRSLAAVLGLVALLLPAATLAQPTRLEVVVAAVSNDGTQVDAALASLAQSFKRNGLAYTSYKLKHSANLSLSPGKSASIPLGKGEAKVTLVKAGEGGTVTLKLDAPNNAPTFDMTPGGEFIQQVGTIPDGKLFLIIRR